MNSVLAFVIALGILIFVHELGHFLFAKLFGVRVEKFSLGFGPRLVGRKYGETEYLVSAFPLGGYVKMFGEQRGEEVEGAETARSFSHRPVWQRFCIVAGGPFFNLLLAVLLFFLIFFWAGLPQLVPTTEIGQVAPESPAAAMGLEAGDEIVAINGEPTADWEQISELIQQSGGEPVQVMVERNGSRLELTGRPEQQESKNIFGEVIGERYLLGIARSEEVFFEDASLVEAIRASFNQTWNFMYLTVMGVIKIIQQVVPASELGGPILIAQLAGQQMEAGWLNLVHFMGLLSVNLGILNLLPIPVLDGGHLVFLGIEGVMRKPLNIRTQEIWQQIGLMLLAALMIFVFYNDLLKLFGS